MVGGGEVSSPWVGYDGGRLLQRFPEMRRSWLIQNATGVETPAYRTNEFISGIDPRPTGWIPGLPHE
jgi:hypothetical protein